MTLSRDRLTLALLGALEGSHDISTQTSPPMLACCTRHERNERFLLKKKIKLRAAERHEHLYLFYVPVLSFNSLAQCLDTALEAGTKELRPGPEHTRTEVSSVILCDRALPDALELLEGYKHSRRFKLSLHGRLVTRVAAVELATGELTLSRHAKPLAALLSPLLGAASPSTDPT